MIIASVPLFFEFILAPFIFTLFAPQFIAGFYAKQTGRSFWFWFWISFLIPIISIIILMSKPDKTKEVAEIKNP